MQYQATRAITSWKTFIAHFDNVPSFVTFKGSMNTFFRPKANSVFGIHYPIILRYLFQLRVSLSPLSHKLRHNFDDTPGICRCNQGIEDLKYVTKIQPELLRQSIAIVVIRSWITQFY